VTSDAAWLTLSSAGATGSGSFTWTAAANTGTARTANLSVSGRTIHAAQGANSGPAGSVTIASGAGGTSTTAVTLTLSASDSDGVGTMCISNTASCTAWEAYATSRAWTLSNSGTPRTVYATFRDAYGNTGAATTDTILYDATAPTNGTVLAAPAAGQVTLSWSGFADATSGVASYKVVQGTTSAPANCSTGTLAYTGAATTTAITGLTDGTTYGFRVCAVDAAGNTGTGATVTSRPAPEYNAPSGTVTAAAGAAWSNTRSVAAALSATDDTAVATMCLSATTTCTTFVAYNTAATVTLGTTPGTQTVYATFRDTYGNTAAAVTDTIGYDATVPTNGTVLATPASGQVTLSWSGFADATSGVASYKVVRGTTSAAPTNCSTGTLVYTGAATTTAVTGLTGGAAYGFRVCAVDTAGNTGTGATVSATPQ
jgi:hypothetical protein